MKIEMIPLPIYWADCKEYDKKPLDKYVKGVII